MKVRFTLKGHNFEGFDRDVPAVPRYGDVVTRHRDSGSTLYKVCGVTHVYEDREWYINTAKEDEDLGDTVWVELEITS